jgi:hypothetical protein
MDDQDPAPQEIADLLLSEGCRLDDGRPADDISIVVIKVVQRLGDEVRRMMVRLPFI